MSIKQLTYFELKSLPNSWSILFDPTAFFCACGMQHFTMANGNVVTYNCFAPSSTHIFKANNQVVST
jgi:hypothetical protein